MRQMIMVCLLVMGASPVWAQLQQIGGSPTHTNFRSEMERLSRESRLQNPLVLLDFSCQEEEACEPVLRMFVRTTSTDNFRLPMLPPKLFSKDSEIRVDKKRYKVERKLEESLFEEACKELPKEEMCEGRWKLKKVFRLSGLEASTAYKMTLKTTLQKPGATGSQIGALTPVQTLLLEIPQEAVASGVVVFLWEENGVLNVPQTFAPGPA